MDFGSLEQMYATDEDKAINGVEVEIGINIKDDPMAIKVAHLRHPKVQKVFRKYDKAMESSRHIPKKRQLVWARFISEAVLKDWKGILDSKGKVIPPTRENMIKALTQIEKFFNDVLDASDNIDNFRPEFEDNEEDTEKN